MYTTVIRNRNITHLSRMEFPTFISWISLFLNQGLYGGIYFFIQNLIRAKQSGAEGPACEARL